MKMVLVFLLFALLWMGGVMASSPSQLLPSFFISKDKNQNVVHYEVKTNSDCTFAGWNPFEIYWTVPGSNGQEKRENLNTIEKGLYGFDVIDRSKQKIKAEVRAIKNQHKKIVLTFELSGQDSQCQLKVLASGDDLEKELLLDSISLRNFNGSKPRLLVLEGRAIPTASEKISESLKLF